MNNRVAYKCVKDKLYGKGGCAACATKAGCIVFVYPGGPPPTHCLYSGAGRQTEWKEL